MRLRWSVVALFLLPGATAMAVSLEAPDTTIDPDIEFVDLSATVTVPCTELLPRVDPATQTAIARLEFTSIEEVVVTGPQLAVLYGGECITGADVAAATVHYTVGVTRNAPGLEPLQAGVSATLPGNAAFPALEASASTDVIASYYAALEAKVAEPLQASGSPFTYSVRVTNFGNAATLVTFALTEGHAGDVALPAPIVLGRAGSDTASTDVEVVIRSDAALRTYQLQLTPSAVADPDSEGAPVTVDVLARNRMIPGPGTPLVVAGTLAAAAVAMRRRA